MKNLVTGSITALVIFLAGCTGNHFIEPKSLREKIEEDFNKRKQLAVNRDSQLFSIFSNKLSTSEEECLKFLFAYMPLNDLADYNGDFFLANARSALDSRNESKWAETIPIDIFLHYVLPPRVNNENLDTFRMAYYRELHDRISGMGQLEAALEINHWCHEKVSYQGADSRTSAPLSTMLSARGRCGEESTFTVAALRTAGIPARQVYTPRWAHSDDNHAWVEFWANGKWYYMGACEPDAVVNRGWFTEPARRAMLVHTKSFGIPTATENVIISTDKYSIVNSLSTYAVTKNLYTRVIDADNNPVENAAVEYKLYNYAEFYPLATVPTNSNGISKFETGLGDLLVWAHKDNKFAFARVTVNEIDTLVLKLTMDPIVDASYEYDLGVPVVRQPFAGPPANLVAENTTRLGNEDKIRQAYIDSWGNGKDPKAEAEELLPGSKKLPSILLASMGNRKTIVSFLGNTSMGARKKAMDLLGIIAEKDLRDTPESVLRDHLDLTPDLKNCVGSPDSLIYIRYILNPRVAHEILVPFRSYFLKNLSDSLKKSFAENPASIVNWIKSYVTLDDESNYYKTPITPVGVFELRVTDSFSRDIFFVAICRTLGIAARLDEGSLKPQFFFNGNWIEISFRDKTADEIGKGYLTLKWDGSLPEPEYYLHFTLARFENGKYVTLEYDYNKRVSAFSKDMPLDKGYYMLVTGNRISDSRILSSVRFFKLDEGEHRELSVDFRKNADPPAVIGNIDLEKAISYSNGNNTTLRTLAGKGIVLIWAAPGTEPTRHIFNDLPLLSKELDDWGGQFIFFWDNSVNKSGFDKAELTGLPSNSKYLPDPNLDMLASFCGGLSCSTAQLPLVIVANPKGEVIYRSQGYRIGIGEQILRAVRR
ncbi:MAG: transglutaminase domain-containing protein [Bacteroidales bacterium]